MHFTAMAAFKKQSVLLTEARSSENVAHAFPLHCDLGLSGLCCEKFQNKYKQEMCWNAKKKENSSFAKSFLWSFYSEQPETSTHCSKKKKKNQEQTKHINVQIIQLHQVWSHRRKEKGDPSLKTILKHLKLNSVHFTVAPHSLSVPSQWTPSESRSIHLRLTHPKSDEQM